MSIYTFEFQLPLAGKCKWIFPMSTFNQWFTAVSCQFGNNYIVTGSGFTHIVMAGPIQMSCRCIATHVTHSTFKLQVMDFQKKRAIKVLDSLHIKQLSVPKRIK